ncbi:MAG: hypothetical protein JO073_07650, partial [Actinobacteria bacterium]|nr:hypothetical protein [Actinomycetota bacterium]
MNVLAVGDSYMPVRYFEEAFAVLADAHRLEFLQVDDTATPPDLPLKEYQGSPEELAARMPDVEVLVVQGAPVTAEVLDASRVLRLVGCARGGPVNVDVAAVTARGLPLVNTPGKNAE